MIRYIGGPITPLAVAEIVWKGRHAFVSFHNPDQIGLVAKVCQTFALDNGAFSAWTKGAKPDWPAYREWVQDWGAHPGCDFAVIPDVIDGDEKANDDLVNWWCAERSPCISVPVWHLHESLDRLRMLCEEFPRVALGSSGLWRKPGSPSWWTRMADVMAAVCDPVTRRPICKLHGLRMNSNTIVSQLPLSSSDSTNIARNHARWATDHRLTPIAAAHAMPSFIDDHETATRAATSQGLELNFDLAG